MIKKMWDRYGEENPYYAVLALDKFDKEKFSTAARDEFFNTGFNYTKRIWNEIKLHFEIDLNPRNALDFGCGVGRMVIPLAERSEKVVGVDISEKMIEKARENSLQFGFDNTRFVQADDFFANNKETFDLIHSFIVFQHIKPKIGLRIFENLIKVLNEDGIGIIQFSYKYPVSRFESFRFNLYSDFAFIYKVRNFLKRDDLQMFPMYEYNLNEIFYILQRNDCHRFFTSFSDHGMKGVVIFFQKKKADAY